MHRAERTDFHAGLPKAHFVNALLWQPAASTGNSRPDFGASAPSWSWAGWTLGSGCFWRENDILEKARFCAGAKIRFCRDAKDHESSAQTSYNHGCLVTGISKCLSPCVFMVYSASVKRFQIGGVVQGHQNRYHVLDGARQRIGDVQITGSATIVDRFTTTSFWGVTTGSPSRSFSPDHSIIPRILRRIRADTKETPEVEDNVAENQKRQHRRKLTWVPLPRSEWRVVKVMLISIRDSEAGRVGLGQILLNCWKEQEGQTLDLCLK